MQGACPTVCLRCDTHLQNFVAKTCRPIIGDVEKLDAIQKNGFIHYQLLRFCQATGLQYINRLILLGNRYTLQQQHVDKIADTLLKKGTKQHSDGWDVSSKAWVHMVLHLPHDEGGFCVTFNDITKDDAFYTTTSPFVV